MSLKKAKYILVMAEFTSDPYVCGGFVIEDSDMIEATQTWRKLKTKLCGNPNAELKWEHCFTNADDNPLIMENRVLRKVLARKIIKTICHEIKLLPLVGVKQAQAVIAARFEEFLQATHSTGWILTASPNMEPASAIDLKFVGSENSALIQMAACVCGMVYSVTCGDELYLRTAQPAFEAAEQHQLGLVTFS